MPLQSECIHQISNIANSVGATEQFSFQRTELFTEQSINTDGGDFGDFINQSD